MFKDACSDLSKWMFPVIVAARSSNGSVDAFNGTGILVNEDGWLLTAGHLVKMYVEMRDSKSQHQARQKELEAKEEDINSKSTYSPKRKKQLITNLHKREPVRITQTCFVFMDPKVKVSRALINPAVDLGAFKLDGFAVPDFYSRPVFREEEAQLGECLCRVGYPFNEVKATWNSKTDKFDLQNPYPMPMFANDAMVSQKLNLVTPDDGNQPYPLHQYLTSTTGIKGQSGGPLVDPNGKICGIQVQTRSFPLGFTPKHNGKEEHQFLNAGIAVDTDSILGFLTAHGIDHYKG